MDFLKFMEDFANEIDGQYSEYDDSKSVIVVPLEGGRYQTVVGSFSRDEKLNRDVVGFISKVCDVDAGIDFKRLLEENAKFQHGKFSIKDGELLVEATAFLDNSSEEVLKEMVTEVANNADDWEFKITGLDVN